MQRTARSSAKFGKSKSGVRSLNVVAWLLFFLVFGVQSALGDPTLTQPRSGTLHANFAIDFTIASNAEAGSASLDFYVGNFYTFELFKITFGSDFESAYVTFYNKSSVQL